MHYPCFTELKPINIWEISFLSFSLNSSSHREEKVLNLSSMINLMMFVLYSNVGSSIPYEMESQSTLPHSIQEV